MHTGCMKQERENPNEIEGKQALFVVNLEAEKMMGEVYEGMLFDIGYADGITPVLAIPQKTCAQWHKSRIGCAIPYKALLVIA